MRFIILLTILFFSACTLTEEPSFVKVEDLKLEKQERNVYALSGDLVYFNPNDLGGKLKELDIELKLSNYSFGKIQKQFDIEVPAKSEFAIPLDHELNFQNSGLGQELITLLLTAAIKREVVLSYSGKTSLEIAGIDFEIPVNYSDTIPFGR